MTTRLPRPLRVMDQGYVTGTCMLTFRTIKPSHMIGMGEGSIWIELLPFPSHYSIQYHLLWKPRLANHKFTATATKNLYWFGSSACCAVGATGGIPIST
ncbi:hypothetical protein NPIL_90301 [Nephila pilipes]|uniref:Uncharacterized protein n=1 Tax=Nephila pilipes TaxID=299642 RepID=A0A8X6PX96_NEPPI|nr:hypothetical protein NPIL_90301 [Nephila pilipes]